MSEPYESFHHAGLKIKWAYEHIVHLNQHLGRWVNSKPYTISVEKDPDTGGHCFKVGMTEPMPAWIPLSVGDICANLRTSLDFAWMGLVRAADPRFPEKKTMPIATNRKGLVSTVDQAPIGSAVTQATTLLTEAICAHQDFADGGSQFLVALNKLTNWNKHNLLVTSLAVTRLTNLQIGGVSFGKLNVTGGIGNIVTFGEAIPKPELEYDDNPTVEIIFGEHDLVSRQPVIPTLLNFHHCCSDGLQAFRNAFPTSD